MNKLFKFAGVSALSLIVAAPNAFGAYGRYDPSCKTQFGVAVNVYGFSNGKYTDLNAGMTYDPISNKFFKGETEITTVNGFLKQFDISTAPGSVKMYTDSANTKAESVNISTNLIAYAAGFIDGGPAEGTSFGAMMTAAETAVPYNLIATASTCVIPANNKDYALIREFEDGTMTGQNTLPNISALVTGPDGNQEAVSFVIYYAADCISETQQNTNHASCSFNVNNEGRVTYKNMCLSGYKGNDFGNPNRVCISDLYGEPMTVPPESSLVN